MLSVRQKKMKLLMLFFAILATILLLSEINDTGITRPKAIAGAGAFAATFWYYFWRYRQKELAAAKKKPNQ